MNRKKILKKTGYFILIFLSLWFLLTLWVEKKGPARSWTYGHGEAVHRACIIFDPDPFYNLDEQICRSFAEALAGAGFSVRVSTVAAIRQLPVDSISVYIFCANTYNWYPDWALTDFIKNCNDLKGKPVVAITLGAGSTFTSRKKLETLIQSKQGIIIDSRSFWLLRPNDEKRMKESNVKVAVSMAWDWAREIAYRLHTR